MNNSETKFCIKALKVEQVICVLRRIMGQPLFSRCESCSPPSHRVLAALQRELQIFRKHPNLSDVCKGFIKLFLLVTDPYSHIAFISQTQTLKMRAMRSFGKRTMNLLKLMFRLQSVSPACLISAQLPSSQFCFYLHFLSIYSISTYYERVLGILTLNVLTQSIDDKKTPTVME